MFLIALVTGAKILQYQIGLKFSTFLYEVLLKITIVALLSSFPILYISTLYIKNDILKLFIISGISVCLTSIVIYVIGLNKRERQFIAGKIKDYLKKIYYGKKSV